MQQNSLEDVLIDELSEHFKSTVKSYVVKRATDVPHTEILIRFIAYEYFVIDLLIEKNKIFFSIKEGDVVLKLVKSNLKESHEMDKNRIGVLVLDELNKEIRLRIPDKYLVAKGWG